MFASFTPAQAIALTFVTSRLIIQGTVETRVRRVADIFNEADVTHLILTNAVFLEVGSRRVVAQAAVAQIPLEDILFAHPSGPTEGTSEMRVPKQAVRATLLLPPCLAVRVTTTRVVQARSVSMFCIQHRRI